MQRSKAPSITTLLLLVSASMCAQECQAEPESNGLCDALESAFYDFGGLRPVDEVRSGRRFPQGYECAKNYFVRSEPSRCVVRGGVQEQGAEAWGWSLSFGWLHEARAEALDQLESLKGEMRACKRFEIDFGNVDMSQEEVTYDVKYAPRRRQSQNGVVKMSVGNVIGNKSRGSFWTFVTIQGMRPD